MASGQGISDCGIYQPVSVTTALWGPAITDHIPRLLGIFITLLAAVLDTPKDWDTPTGPNSRLTSQV